jgi:hypothetical protein
MSETLFLRCLSALVDARITPRLTSELFVVLWERWEPQLQNKIVLSEAK